MVIEWKRDLILKFTTKISPVRDDSSQAGMESVARNACNKDQILIRVPKVRQKQTNTILSHLRRFYFSKHRLAGTPCFTLRRLPGYWRSFGTISKSQNLKKNWGFEIFYFWSLKKSFFLDIGGGNFHIFEKNSIHLQIKP